MKSKIKVGQRVLLINEIPRGEIAGGYVYEMRKWLGKEVIVRGVFDDHFTILEDRYEFMWDYKFIKELKPVSKVHGVDKFISEDYIIPVGYSLERVIENDRAVICFVKEERTRKTIKTVAICQKEDTFDLHKGVKICMYKTLRKIADRNLKKF